MVEKRLPGEMTPTELARQHGINRYNVYYWIKKYELGSKRKKFWYLTLDEQKQVLQLNESDSVRQTLEKKPTPSKRKRFNTQMSVEAIYTELDADMDTAVLIKNLTTKQRSSKLITAIEKIFTRESRYYDLAEHELVLLIIGALLKKTELRALRNDARIDVYKYLGPVEDRSLTVVFDLHANAYYLASPKELELHIKDVVWSEEGGAKNNECITRIGDTVQGELFERKATRDK